MFRPVICAMGDEATRRFYDGEHFTRTGSMPQTTLRLLQDKGSVQTLDGQEHGHRKAMFMHMLTGDAVGRIGDLFDSRWDAAMAEWRRQGRIVFHHEMARLLCDVICDWSGVPVTGKALDARTRETKAMIDGAGTAGPRAWYGLLLRRRTERWARRAIRQARKSPERTGATAVEIIAHHRDSTGALPDVRSAGVELVNVIRPTVAVARFITFAALALHEHPAAAAWLRADVDGRALAFAQEVRRFYPFFPVVGGRVREPFTWRGHRFAVGAWVLLGLHATNHDARLWEGPEQFRPERFLDANLVEGRLVPQGGGDHWRDHRCPGEWITTELIRRALLKTLALEYSVPAQSLHVRKDRFPTLPASGFVMEFR